jgi:hypothetical protein
VNYLGPISTWRKLFSRENRNTSLIGLFLELMGIKLASTLGLPDMDPMLVPPQRHGCLSSIVYLSLVGVFVYSYSTIQ